MKLFDSVAKLKLANLTIGQLVETKGYTTAGDGGQARYMIVAPQALDTGDETIANGNIALFQFSGNTNKESIAALEESVDNLNTVENFATFAVPTLFGWDPDFKVIKNGDGSFTDFDFESKKVVGTTYYVDYQNGDDSNSGTEASPFKTMKFLFDTTSGNLDVVLFSGIHHRDSIPNLTLDRTFNLRALDRTDPPKISTTNDNEIWTKTGGQTNVYQVNALNNPTVHSFDAYNTKVYGVYTRLISVGDIATVDSTQGSIFIDGDTTYIHTINSRPADDDIRLFTQDNNFSVAGQNTVYLENIIFEGGNSAAFSAEGVDGEVQVYNVGCQFNYAAGGEGGVKAKGFGKFYSKNSGAHQNRQDGFNYKWDLTTSTGKFLEDNCVASGNGESDTAINDQGSTSHDGIIGVRVNGVYTNNISQGIGDITAGTETWNINCECTNATTLNSTYRIGIVAFSFAKVFVDDCYTSGNDWSLRVEPDAFMYVRGNRYGEPILNATVDMLDFNGEPLVSGTIGSFHIPENLSMEGNVTTPLTIKLNDGFCLFLDRTEHAIIDKIGSIGVTAGDINSNIMQFGDGVTQQMNLGLSAGNLGNLTISGAYSPFTGTHIYWSDEDIETGLAVDLVNAAEKTISDIDTVGKITLCKTEASRICAGIIESKLVSGSEFVYLVAQVGDNRTNKLKGFIISEAVQAGNILITGTGGKLKNAVGDEDLSVVKFKAMETQTDISKPVYGYFI